MSHVKYVRGVTFWAGLQVVLNCAYTHWRVAETAADPGLPRGGDTSFENSYLTMKLSFMHALLVYYRKKLAGSVCRECAAPVMCMNSVLHTCWRLVYAFLPNNVQQQKAQTMIAMGNCLGGGALLFCLGCGEISWCKQL